MNTDEIIDEIKNLDSADKSIVVSELKEMVLDSLMDNEPDFVINEILDKDVLLSIINDNIKFVCDSIVPEDYVSNYGEDENYLNEIFDEVISKQVNYYCREEVMLDAVARIKGCKY